MGFDVTYHPMTPEEMKLWYFDRLAEIKAPEKKGFLGLRKGGQESDVSEAVAKVREIGLPDDGADLYSDILTQTTKWSDPARSFNATHGFMLASAQTAFANYWYLRGSAFCLFAEIHPPFARFIAPLSEALGFVPDRPVLPGFDGNYSAGAWMSAGNIASFVDAYAKDAGLREAFDGYYLGGQLDVITDVLLEARDAGRGILEATDLFVPNILDIAQSTAICYVPNMKAQGLRLYRDTAMAQLRAAGVPIGEDGAPSDQVSVRLVEVDENFDIHETIMDAKADKTE